LLDGCPVCLFSNYGFHKVQIYDGIREICGWAVDIVATDSYHKWMKPLKTVGIKELKNNLSQYLREVRSGATVLISDRNNVVCELREIYGQANIAGTANPLLIDWVQSGIVSLPVAEKQPLKPSCVSLPSGTAKDLLKGDRKESGD
jgi:hypothetical protein